jgi:hypothetical protein
MELKIQKSNIYYGIIAVLLLILLFFTDFTTKLLFFFQLLLGLPIFLFLRKNKNIEELLLLSLVIPMLIPFLIQGANRFLNFSTTVYILFFFLALVIVLGIIKKKDTFHHNINLFKAQKSLIPIILFLLLFLIIFFAFPDLHAPSTSLGRTDGIPEFHIQQTTIKNVQEYDKIFLWNSDALLGYPELFIHTLGTIYMGSFFDFIFPSLDPIFLHKFFYFVSLFILLFGIYLVNKRISNLEIPSFLVSLMIVASPIFIDIFAYGRLRSFTAYIFVPLLFYFAMDLDKKENYIILPFIMLSQFVWHPILCVMALAILHFFIALILIKEWVTKDKLFSFKEKLTISWKNLWTKTKPIIFIDATMFVLLLYWPIEFFHIKDYFWGGTLNSDLNLDMFTVNYIGEGIKFSYIFVIFFIILTALLILNFKKDEKAQKTSFIYLGLFLFSLGYIIPFTEPIWAYLVTAYHKFSRMVMVIGSLGLTYIFHAIKTSPPDILKKVFTKERRQIVYVILLLTTIIFVSANLYNSSNIIKEGMSEEILTNEYFISWGEKLSGLEYGRFFSYGIFTLAFDPAMQYFSDQPMASFGLWDLSKINIHKRIRNDEVLGSFFKIENDQLIPDLSSNQVINDFRYSAIKYVYVFLCGNQIAPYTLLYINSTNQTTVIDSDECMQLLEITDSNYADVPLIEPVGVSDLYLDESEDDWMKIYIKEKPIQVNGNTEYLEVDYIRINPQEISLYTDSLETNTLVRVKEQYNPFWHAYDDQGNELEIMRDNFGTMYFVLENSSNEVLLELKHPIYIRILSAMGALLVLLFALSLFFYKKPKILA